MERFFSGSLQFDPDIPVSVKGKARHQTDGFAVRYIEIFCFGCSQILVIEIALLQNLAHLQMNSGSCRLIDLQRPDAGNILTDIQDTFSGRRFDLFFHRE